MTTILHPLTVIWIGLPFFLGFLIYLMPQMDRIFSLVMVVATATFAALLFVQPASIDLSLLDHFGVTLSADTLSAYFILTNALVTAAVLIYCWRSDKSAFFYAQLAIAHGSVNAAFICADFVSLYVAIEVLSIAAFLLIAYPRTDRTIWVGLRYLFASNTAMLFYLMGAALVYQANQSFSFTGLQSAPAEAIALILLGLLAKGGIFIPGLWLPITHSEAETPVSALLSGVVVKVGVFPLVRCALLTETITPVVQFLGVATALMGVSYALFEKDTKRMLAFSTLSQMGFVLAAPAVGSFYALTHGLVKSCLFLISGNLPTRSFQDLQQKPMSREIWVALAIASLSISGLPLLAGFAAKAWTLKEVLPWQSAAMTLAAVGTAAAFAKFLFLPRGSEKDTKPGFWGAIALLLSSLVVANLAYLQAYTLPEIVKALLIIGAGWVAYFLIFRRTALKLPHMLEQFEQLIGMMSLMLILLFWMVVT